MKLSIPYGNEMMPLNLDGRSIREVSPKHVSAIDDVLSKSFVNSSLESFVSERKKLLVVINDHTRPFASGLLARLPLKSNDVTTIVATGSHREPTPEELQLLLGGDAPPYTIEISLPGASENVSRCLDLSVRFASGELSSFTHQ